MRRRREWGQVLKCEFCYKLTLKDKIHQSPLIVHQLFDLFLFRGFERSINCFFHHISQRSVVAFNTHGAKTFERMKRL